ncbi:MAG: pyridoxamine 5'-phosphate oxidase family protein [Pseudomonadota bacterium]
MTTLNDLLDAALDGFAAGAAPGRSPFSMIYAATIGVDGRPRVRTVVIRRFDRDGGGIWFNTDLRSPKAAEIDADRRISVLAYDRDGGFQMRVEGEAILHRDGGAKAAAWTASAARSRICYRHAYGPSDALDDPANGDPTEAMRAPVDADAGFENFGAVEVRMETMDVLDLAGSGHRRALFTRADGAWTGRWLAP